MKKLLLLAILFVSSQNVFSNWEHSFFANTITDMVTYSNNLYLGRYNGITEYNLFTKNTRQITMLNSELPSHRINAFLKMEENKYLVSTRKGLCIFSKGVISANEPICLDYPDNDARKLYMDSKKRIWTYSSHKVHCYDNGNWKTINLEDSVTYGFDIWELSFAKGDVWVMFNDNKWTQTRFYDNFIVNLWINIAVISNFEISKVFDKKAEFPLRQGDYSICDAGDFIVWMNYDSVYKYQNNVWQSTTDFHHNGNKPFAYYGYEKDSKGNIWYTVSNNSNTIAYLVSYNPQNGEKTAYLQNEEEKLIAGIYILENEIIITKSSNAYYILRNNVWEKKERSDFGANESTYFDYPCLINNKIYTMVSGGNFPDGGLVCIEDGTYIPPTYQGLHYPSLSQVEFNKFGQGIFRSEYINRVTMEYKADSGFVNLSKIVNHYSPQIKPLGDGNVYFTNFKIDNTLKSNFLTTWEGIDLVKINMGFDLESDPNVNTFDGRGDYIYGLGNYNYAVDSLSSFVSIYNIKDKTLKTFDRNNSDMHDFYTVFDGFSQVNKDTVPLDITVDKQHNPWILTSMSLMKFNENGSEIFDLTYNGHLIPATKICYDSNSNEIILLNYKHMPIYYMNVENKQIDSFEVSGSGLIGKSIKAKKLFDNNVWAADELGYLYEYTGKGKFKVFDLQINNNRPNLKFPINDFSIDFNRNLYLATEIGLLTNKSILPDIPDVEDTTEVSVNSKISREGLLIYPNPAGDFITIQLSNKGLKPFVTSEKVQIFDILGLEVISVGTGLDLSSNGLDLSTLRIDVSHLPSGVYFIKIGTRVEKFVKM
jgi:hypothetical protein